MKPQTLHLLRSSPVGPILDQWYDWNTLRRLSRQGSFSQHGEDKFVMEYFSNRPGFYIDVGANHPFRLSNTYLLYLNGWRGVTVEPQPALSEKHRRYRRLDRHFNVGVGSAEGEMKFLELVPHVFSSFDEGVANEFIREGQAILKSTKMIPIRTLSSVCQEAGVPVQIDFLSVDCEGHDLDVLRGIDWSKFRPKLVAVETVHNSVGRDIDSLLANLGYRPLREMGCNTFFELPC